MAECVVCGKELEESQMTAEVEHDGDSGYVCCPLCQSEYQDSPGEYL
jgi:hypothetical protein